MPNENMGTSENSTNNYVPQRNNKFIIIAIIVVCVLIAALLVAYFYFFKDGTLPEGTPEEQQEVIKARLEKFDYFSSQEDFQEYLTEAQLAMESGFGMGFGIARSVEPTLDWGGEMAAPSMALEESDSQGVSLGKGGASTEPTRYSETNVQVAGIDEPDIVKTNGQDIFASLQRQYVYREMEPGMDMKMIMPPDYSQAVVQAIKAFPLENLKLASKIGKQGEMLLYKDTLVIFSNDRDRLIYGYDVSDIENPKQAWNIKLDDRTYLVTSRLQGDKIYLVTRTSLTPETICPIPLLTRGEERVELGCKYIYHPIEPITSDSTYTAIELDPESGEVNDRVSFIGSNRGSQIYMSPDALYISYFYSGDYVAFMFNLMKENRDIFPNWLIEKVSKLVNYDISDQSKMSELMILIERFQAGLNKDDRLKFENEMENKMSDYAKEHKRELERTGIAKIDLKSMKVVSTGSVPGSLLNQFSLDEYEGNLRVATTVSGSRSMFGSSESASDVYVLSKNLDQLGSVLDLGLTERIYSVRFIQDKGYVVTFRQVDPFYVLDLSEPKNPQKKGELKIPGYSSYLHPISKDTILGIGKEGSKVKLSLFDVSNSSDPTEEDKYMLDEYSSEVLSNHRAFLMDDKHNIFFLPGNKGGYIFSYKNNKLSLERAVSSSRTKRAIFIDDYLYIITEEELVILDENNWQTVKTLDFATGDEEVIIDEETSWSVESRDSKRVANIKQLQTALELYFNDQNGYPSAPSAITLGEGADCNGQACRRLCSGSSNSSENGFFSTSSCAETTMMSLVPRDEKPGASGGTGTFEYTSASPETYTIVFTLEGKVSSLKGTCTANPSGITCQ